MNNKFKPLNNLLDELNYITLLTNVPTAAYDAKNISNISVTTAKSGETFTGFDTKTYNLNDKDIVIRNNSEVICLAAIMGDNKFGVNNDTKTAYIEIANFNHVNIRKTAQKFAIRTDAS
jgi:phenylalanyl-tRNA synthetase beta chain